MAQQIRSIVDAWTAAHPQHVAPAEATSPRKRHAEDGESARPLLPCSMGGYSSMLGFKRMRWDADFSDEDSSQQDLSPVDADGNAPEDEEELPSPPAKSPVKRKGSKEPATTKKALFEVKSFN